MKKRKVLRDISAAGLLLAVLLLALGNAIAAEINVPGTYTTIQEAINVANPNDTIIVAVGTYNENLTVSKPLTMQGADRGTTVIKVTGSYGIMINGSDVVFSGFTVKQAAPAVVQKALGIGISAAVSNVTISDAVFDGTDSTKSGSMGILVRRASGVVIDNVESFGWTGYGIDVYSATTPKANDVVITNSTFHDNGWFGVAVDRSTNVMVKDCHILGPDGSGIAVFENATYPVTGCVLMGNEINDFTGSGILLVGDSVLVEGNEIYDCVNGVRITMAYWPYYTADNNVLVGNSIYDNDTGVLVEAGVSGEPTNNMINNNNICPNYFYDLDASSLTTTVDATSNWWCDPNGPDLTKIAGPVDYSNYLLAPVGETPEARVLKGSVITSLDDLISEAGKKTGDRIEKAVKHLQKSLKEELWEDDSHLTKKGKKVFKEEEKAVHELMKIEDPDVSGSIDLLIAADEELAQTAIDEAIDAGGDAKEIEKAEKEMAKAQEEIEKGKYDKAIEHYKKAWEHAQKAMKKAVEEDEEEGEE